MVFSGDSFIGRTTCALSASKESAFVDRLVNAAEKVVFVWLGVVFIEIGASILGLFGFFNFNFLNWRFSDLVDHLTLFHSLPSNSFHFFF